MDSSTWAGLAARCLIIIIILSFIFSRENNNTLQLRIILNNEVSVLESSFFRFLEDLGRFFYFLFLKSPHF
jgi:hypothetical protein